MTEAPSRYKTLRYYLYVFAHLYINSIYLSSICFYRYTHTRTHRHTHLTQLLPRAPESCECTVQRCVSYIGRNPSLCLELTTKEKPVEGKRMPRKTRCFWAHTSQGPAPAVENEIPTWGILTTQKPAKERGNLRSGGGVRASEAMFCRLGKTNRLLPTKQKLPVGKSICRGTCAGKG